MVFHASPSFKKSFCTRALQALFRGVIRRRRRAATLTNSDWSNTIEGLEERVMLSGTTADDHDHGPEAGPGDHVHTPGATCTPLAPPQEGPFDDPQAGPYPESETFKLHSKPDSNYTIYLDFDGHVVTGTRWNNAQFPTMNARAYDTDGDPTTFSTAEQDYIQLVWQAVAEDFAPFDVNVTTEDPGVEALQKTGSGDTKWGVRSLITYDDFGTSICGGGSGGCAYLNAFDHSVDEPGWVFNVGNVNVTAMTISHEVGHNLGLGHDGDAQNVNYYSGHGTGNTGWGPILGAPFSKRVTHWNNGDYFTANNQQDDLATIVGNNGFGYRSDDHGNVRTSASEFNIQGLINVDSAGIIEQNTDIDYFRFETGTGPVSFQISNFSNFPNLDVWAGIFDSTGTLVAESNLVDDLSAAFTGVQLQAGVYFLRVEGVGTNDVYNPATDRVEGPASKPWTVANPLGYSDYGSLGFYTITGVIQPSQIDFGDAPDTFGTLEATDGARHVAAGVTLGTLRDFEPDGLPSVNATGDGVDEDGVIFGSPLVAGKKANLSILAPAGGVLDAWIDFNGNGTFDTNEQIFTDQVLTVGQNGFVIDVPADALPGQSYARFRIADAADQVTGPTGKADSGEVEDYAVTINTAQQISEVFFNPSGTVDTGAEYIELRGTPNAVIPQGTFFVAVDGEATKGTIEFVYNLSGLSYGANGYLVLLQKDSVYTGKIDPASNVVISTESGWKDFNRKVSFLSGVTVDLDNNSSTYMLLQANVAPRLGDDIDANDDGTQEAAAIKNWTILDSVGNITTTNGAAYASTVFSTNGAGQVPAGTNLVNMGTTVVEYVGRAGASVGSLATDWVGGALESGSVAPVHVLGLASPALMTNRPLDHIGSINFIQSDYGDLPDSYGTLKSSNGASHGAGGPILGTMKDLESNGSPNTSASGDNLINDSDEDGVIIPTLIEGTAGNVSITLTNVTGGAVVQGWFDWNGNGTFEQNEMVINQTVAANGTISVAVTAPIPAFDNTFGSTFARIRVSKTGGLSATGAAVDGEVEDYRVNILTSATDDFGDAPDSYGTTLAKNGARHTGVGPIIGSIRDLERNGNPTPNATGDNQLLLADEDGISYPTPISPGFESIVYVNIVGTGFLDAWLDANLNGTFDANEQIITNRSVSTGLNAVTFTTPAGAKIGENFIRYRLSSTAAGVTSPVGAAPDGEVQDDRVSVLPIFNRPPTLTGAEFTIVENSPNGTNVGTVTGSEPDLGQTLVYSIVSGNLNQAFKINPTTGQITVNNIEAVDFEFKPEFELRIQATDTGVPNLWATATVKINVTDVFDPPSIGLKEGSPENFVVAAVPLPTLLPANVDQYTIIGGNTNTGLNINNVFKVDALGIIRVNNSAGVDYESNPIFNLVVQATDNAGPTTETVTLKIKLIDRNEAPTIGDYEFVLSNNAQPGALVGIVKAADPDLEPSLTYSLYSGNENGAFSINPSTGRLSVVNPSSFKLDADRTITLGLLVVDNGEFLASVDSKITIRLRDDIFFDNFETGSLNPANWTPGPNVIVGTVGGSKAVVMGTTGAAQNQELLLKVNISQKENIVLTFDRTIATAGTTGTVEVSNDGIIWKTVNTFNGAALTLGQTQHLALSITDALAPGTPNGDIFVRFKTSAVGAGLTIDNVGISGLPKTPTASDVLVYDANTNTFVLGISNGTGFDRIEAPWVAGNNWQFFQGDFNGDGMTDVAGFNAAGEIHVGIATGTGLTITKWLDWGSPSVEGWHDFQVGDFNGDGRSDIAARKFGGYWFIAQSQGNSFTSSYSNRWGADGWDNFVVGDFNGDGKDDIAGDRSATGDWWVNFGTDGIFRTEAFGRWSATADWQDVLVGDYNGDGKDDIAGRTSTGQWWIGNSSGTSFSLSYGVSWSGRITWEEVVVGDFNGDGKDDILGRHSGGEWYLNRSVGNRFQMQYYGRWSSTINWTTVVGDFNNDGKDDVAGFAPNYNAWFVGLGGGNRLLSQFFGNTGLINQKFAGAGQLN